MRRIMMFLVVLLSVASFAQVAPNNDFDPRVGVAVDPPIKLTPYQQHLWDLAGCMSEPLDCPMAPDPMWNPNWVETDILTNDTDRYDELIVRDQFGYVTIAVAELPVVSEWRRERSFNWFDVGIYQHELYITTPTSITYGCHVRYTRNGDYRLYCDDDDQFDETPRQEISKVTEPGKFKIKKSITTKPTKKVYVDDKGSVVFPSDN